VDLEAPLAVRRLGLPHEEAEGLLQRHLREAMSRRARWFSDPRHCRLVNDEGDALPGLVIDRYDSHYLVQPLSRAMEARAPEIARSLQEMLGAHSVLLRTDGPLRNRAQLAPARPRVLLGSPPRWGRILDEGARMTFDLFEGQPPGYPYDERELRRLLARASYNSSVLELNCRLGGLFVHAGLHGAKRILATTASFEDAELARENAEANGLMSRAAVRVEEPLTTLSTPGQKFDLVLFRIPSTGVAPEALADVLRRAVRTVRRGGIFIPCLSAEAAPQRSFEETLARACQAEDRVPYLIKRPSVPADFPRVLGSSSSVFLDALVLEVG
jgi:23S rRNA (cytosine1962-C5)-methyltransferase